MKKHRIMATEMSSGYGSDPLYTGIVASSPEESVEIFFDTMKAPILAASVLKSSQDALLEMDSREAEQELNSHVERFINQPRPKALDIAFTKDGNDLCINLGTGAIFFELSDKAKKSLGIK